MFPHNFVNLLGNHKRHSLLAFAFNKLNNSLKSSNEYQNNGLSRTSDPSSISYSISGTKNGCMIDDA